MRKHVIRSITFQPDGSVAIEYVTPARDLRANGLEHNSVLLIPYGTDYYEENLDELADMAERVLEDALEDFDAMEPLDLEDLSHLDGADADDDEDE